MRNVAGAGGGSPFARFWLAAAISSFGTAVTAVALPVLVVSVLSATPFEVGVVNAAQFVPYAVIGLIAGVYTDRWRRRPVLVWGSLGRAATLGAIPVLWLLGALQIWALVVLLLVFGGFSVFAFAASQSLLPSIVPRDRLVVANARLDQTDAAAGTVGPALAGGLVGLLGAPVAIAVDAASYLVDAVLNAGLRVDERRAPPGVGRNLRAELAEGLRWIYRRSGLGPLAVSTHIWFVANGAAFTALSVVTLRGFGLSPFGFGLLMALGGVTGLVGATLAPAVARRIGSGPAVLWCRVCYPVAWLAIALVMSSVAGLVVLFVGLSWLGFVGGVENSNEMALRQRMTPDRLLGRTNGGMRSMNRTAGAVGALLGGVALQAFGARVTLLSVAVIFGAAALVIAFSPFRHPSDDDAA